MEYCYYSMGYLKLQLLFLKIPYDIGRLLENDIITWNFLAQELKEQSRADLLFKIALNIEDAPIEKLADAVIEINDAKFIYDFARDVKGAPIEKLADAIIKIGDAEYIYNFAYNVKGAPLEKLEDAVINTGDAEYIYQYARYIKGASIERLADAMINTGSAEYICDFACYINNVSIEPFILKLIELGRIDCISTIIFRLFQDYRLAFQSSIKDSGSSLSRVNSVILLLLKENQLQVIKQSLIVLQKNISLTSWNVKEEMIYQELEDVITRGFSDQLKKNRGTYQKLFRSSLNSENMTLNRNRKE